MSQSSLYHYKSYDKKYKPLFTLTLFTVIRSKDFTLILENLITRQITYRHAADCKHIDFEKLSNFNIPSELTDAFEILSMENIQDIFDIPNLKSKADRIRITNVPPLQEYDDRELNFLEAEILNSPDLNFITDTNNKENDRLPVIVEDEITNF